MSCAPRRLLSLWFPRLAAERWLRVLPQPLGRPLAVVASAGGVERVVSACPLAGAAGLAPGMPVRDAHALCPDLIVRPVDPSAEAAFRSRLVRWAHRFAPLVAPDGVDGLMLDVTGVGHLFGGETGLAETLVARAAALGLTVRVGIAGTQGAAWAVARYASVPQRREGAEDADGVRDGPGAGRDACGVGTGAPGASEPVGASGAAVEPGAGAAIRQEARATRSRAAGTPPSPPGPEPRPHPPVIVPEGGIAAALDPLPVAALRLDADTVGTLRALGLDRVGALRARDRVEVARRVGPEAVARLDRVLGHAPDPIGAAPMAPARSVRLALPDPVGRAADVLAATERLLDALTARLAAAGLVARRFRLVLWHAGGGAAAVEVALARAVDRSAPVLALFRLKLEGIETRFGFDAFRLEALDAAPSPPPRPVASGRDEALADLIGRIGARIGTEAVTVLHPADSHVPERAVTIMAAAHAEAPPRWGRGAGLSVAAGLFAAMPGQGDAARPAVPTAPRGAPGTDPAASSAPSAPPVRGLGGVPLPRRPLRLCRPEPVTPEAPGAPPAAFRWRRRRVALRAAAGPERMAPEWWLDDPAWRSGVRDYWCVEIDSGERLWLAEAKGAEMPGGWFVHGLFD